MTESQMTRRIAPLATAALLVFGCSRSGKMQRGQQQYDVVKEGSASGVTSTINGPGETTAPATDTNADTTTNFTLPTNPNPLGNDTAGSPSLTDTPPMPKKRHVPQPETDTSATTATTDTTATTTTLPRPPPTDTTGTQR
jgi:hypothetical protein